MLGIGCFLSLLVSFDFIYVHSTISALLLFTLIALNKEKIEIFFSNLSKFLIFIFLFFLIFLPATWSLANFSKHFIKNDYYLLPEALVNELNSNYDNKSYILVISHQIAPLVINRLGKPIENKTVWLFPSVGQLYRYDTESVRMTQTLENKVYNKPAFWLLKSENEIQGYTKNSDGSFCIIIPKSTPLGLRN